jgi:hypothetical protein
MKMSFLPGKLELISTEGTFSLLIEGQEIFQTRSRRSAIQKFNEIRSEMESKFPPKGPSPEDAKILLERLMTDVRVDETLRRPPKKRSTARSSRTFGG